MGEAPLYGVPRIDAKEMVLPQPQRQTYCIDSLLVRIHLIIETILVDRPYAMGV